MLKQIRVLFLVLAAIAAFSGAASAYDGAVTNRVDVHDNGSIVSLNTTKTTVGEVLEGLDISIDDDDILTPSLDTEITNNLQIYVEKAFMVNIMLDGSPMHLRVNKGTVSQAVERLEKLIGTEAKLISPNKDDSLIPGIEIELVTSYTVIEEVTAETAFETIYEETKELEEGEEEVKSEGQNGIVTTVYEKLFEGNKLVDTKVVETKQVQEPENRIILKGIGKKVPNASDLNYTKVITMRASAYTSDRGDSGTHTKTGERARVGLVAVDPNFIPLGTWLYVEGYGKCRAADTGGMIKGNAIDLFFNTYEECVQFGRREVVVYILDGE